MAKDLMNSVIHFTALQLETKKEDVKLETEIPDIYRLAMFVAMDIGKAIAVCNLQKKYTVEEAICEFERQF
jgi:hypothetical protein